ncbi:DNA-binding transcriptional regulator, LysR family [Propionispira arboris]|uniref:DNA-binding transcriptional regulator, LysR family n=1 Tax=Propionispira arboris TaxID=84035 RepID=A0A1H6TZG5_9FIRM|nr:LysR family transcriptional regulator [Propionispira arboris]SEI85518.1 DNA-binding transcriptional regulator, LysR family [Propionispira arboris]
MELRQLEYFQMVSKVNSFTRAAERLYVSQPAVTNTIRALEDELGIQLFDRSQKQVLLTSEGKIFYNHVENVLHGVSKTLTDINNIKNLNGGILRLALTPLAGVRNFTVLLTKFREKYPQIQLVFEENNNEDGQRALLEDRVDLAFLLPEIKSSSLTYLWIGRQALALCLSVEHPLATAGMVRLEDLVEEPLILFKQDCALRNLLLHEFERNNTLPRIQFESNHIQTIKSLVAENAGIAILPEDLCSVDRKIETVKLRMPLYIDLALAYKTQKSLSHAAKAFIQLAEELYTKKRM